MVVLLKSCSNGTRSDVLLDHTLGKVHVGSLVYRKGFGVSYVSVDELNIVRSRSYRKEHKNYKSEASLINDRSSDPTQEHREQSYDGAQRHDEDGEGLEYRDALFAVAFIIMALILCILVWLE